MRWIKAPTQFSGQHPGLPGTAGALAQMIAVAFTHHPARLLQPFVPAQRPGLASSATEPERRACAHPITAASPNDMTLITLEDPTRRRIPPGTPMPFALGFRPFYFVGALFAVIAIGLWLAQFSGWMAPLPGGVGWHAHEMLFGFAGAVVVGFLMTAGKVWTGLATPTGKPLAALALLWLAGRVVMVLEPHPLSAAIDVAFLLIAGALFARLLVRARSRRNYGIATLVVALALANVGFHLARLDLVATDPMRWLQLALVLIVLIETVVAGRIVPMFTASALPGVRQWRNARFDLACIIATGLALAAWIVTDGPVVALATALAGLMQLARSVGWNPWASRRNPLLWILHLAHLWIALGLLLAAAGALDQVPHSAATHALSIGSMGGLIIGMITRTALGHTGRPLVAGRIETASYVLVQLAVVARVGALVALPALVLPAIHLAAMAWMLAFTLYLLRYAPILMLARADGRPG